MIFSQLAAEIIHEHIEAVTIKMDNGTRGLPIDFSEKLAAKLSTAHNKAILEMLDNIEADIKACSDCPKDESPSIHLFKYRAELTNERTE